MYHVHTKHLHRCAIRLSQGYIKTEIQQIITTITKFSSLYRHTIYTYFCVYVCVCVPLTHSVVQSCTHHCLSVPKPTASLCSCQRRILSPSNECVGLWVWHYACCQYRTQRGENTCHNNFEPVVIVGKDNIS